MNKQIDITNTITTMYTIDNTIAAQSFDKLQVQKLVKTNDFEILSISLEKGAVFPKHTSSSNAQLIMLEGDVIFYIHGEPYHLKAQQRFSFPKETEHWVSANKNSKFLIIR
jgi:quercetin dioxygenase-like cupin family protein